MNERVIGEEANSLTHSLDPSLRRKLYSHIYVEINNTIWPY